MADPASVSDLPLLPDKGHTLDPLHRLAGGVAHEFNNLLTSILGYSELILHTLGPGDERRADVEEILKAARRGATLTRQLLAVSEQIQARPELSDLNAAIRRMESRTRAAVGASVQVSLELQPRLWRIYADPTQLDLVVTNLVTNARDAMASSGGRLTISTANITIESSAHDPARLPPGSYVVWRTSDTGAGFTDEARAHLFEPFFTTKELGKGMGLGLAAVYGTVRRAHGHIVVSSVAGAGATVTIYWPSGEPGELTTDADGLH